MQIVDNIRILWHNDFYDYPRSGVCLFGGEKRYFKLITEMWEKNPNYDPVKDADIECEEDCEYMRQAARIYGVYELTPEELAAEERIHKNFQTHVGMHTDYDEEGSRPIGRVKPREEWDKFYKDPINKREEIDCEFRPAVALWVKQFCK